MILFLESETIWSILSSPAHWIAEIIVTVIFDGVIAGLFYPMIRNCWRTWKHPITDVSSTPFVTPDTYASLCDDCGVPRKRLDTSVDLCTGCGDVKVPK